MKQILALLMFAQQAILMAQSDSLTRAHLADSLTKKLYADSVHIFRFQNLRPYFNLDQRNSFIKDAPINVNGIQLGFLIKEKHVLGFGGYAITQNAKQKVTTKSDKNIDVNKQLDLKYLTIFYQYVAIDKRYFEMDLQAEFGLGKFDLKLTHTKTGLLLQERAAGLLVSGIGPIIALKPFVWVGITGMVGYRFTFEKNPNLNFNGAYYGYGIWLDIRQIIRDCRYLIKKKNYHRQLALL